MFRFLPAIFVIATGLTFAAHAENVIDVTKIGAVGDGATLDTASIQKAIDQCAAAGGGTVDFPAGRYVTGTLQIKSHVTLHLDDQATLLGSTNPADYRNLDPFTDGSGNPMGAALIVAVDADHAGIEGGGAIDGQGPGLEKKEKPYVMRPFLIRWVHCSNVTVRGVHLANPGAWTLDFFRTTGALVDGLTIRTREAMMRNNDGIDIDSSSGITVRNCDIESGDDALVIKSTGGEPTHDITASGCKLSTRCNAIKLGTESYGGFQNITVTHCQVSNTRMAGLALYAVDGGPLENVSVSDVTMDGVSVPISIRLGSRLKTFRAGDQPKTTGVLRHVTISDVSAKNVGMIGILINGVPGHPVQDVTLKNIQLELPGGGTAADASRQLPEKETAYPEFSMFGKTLPASAIYARHLDGVTFENVRIHLLKPDARPATVLLDAQHVKPADFAAVPPAAE